MPELPEVEIVKRGLENAVLGKAMKNVDVARYDLRVPIPKNFIDVIQNKRVEKIQRRGKYIIMMFDESDCAILHLGMSGRIFIHPDGPPKDRLKHDHVFLQTDDGTHVVFNDPRRFGMLYLSPANDWQNEKPFAQMGPEPLGNSFNGPVLHEKLANKKSPIKTALLDQSIVAGLGNIYVCEALTTRAFIRNDSATKSVKPNAILLPPPSKMF